MTLPVRVTRRRVATATTLLVIVVVAMVWRHQLSADSWLGPWAEKPKPEFATLLADRDDASSSPARVFEGSARTEMVPAGRLAPEPLGAGGLPALFSGRDRDDARPGNGWGWGAALHGGGRSDGHLGFGGGQGMGGGGGGIGGTLRSQTAGNSHSSSSSSAPKATTPHRSGSSGGGSGAPTITTAPVVGGTQTTPIPVLIGSGTTPADPGTLGGPGGGGSLGGGGGLSTTPEPASVFLLGSGLLGFAAYLRRRCS